MFPQIVQPDSAKKSSDKVPFAPFLNQETIKQQQENEKKKTAEPAHKKKTEKPAEQKVTVKQTTTAKPAEQTTVAKPVQQNATVKQIPVAPPTVQNNRVQKSNSIVAKDTATTALQPVITVLDSSQADTSLAQTKSASDSFAFHFSDDDAPASVTNNQSQFTSSGKYFGTHLLQNNSEYPSPYSPPVPDWFTVVLILIVCGITTIKIFYNKIFKQLFDAFYSFAVTNQVVRDENILVQRASVLLNVIFYGIAALFLYFISVKFNWSNPFFNQGILRFFLFAIIIACFYSIKMLVLKVLGYVLEIDKAVAVYIFNIFLINNILGMALIPVVALLAYLSLGFSVYVVYAGAVLVIASFLYRMFRAFSIGSSMSLGSLYYLFIYFCALEIAPVLVLIKFAAR